MSVCLTVFLSFSCRADGRTVGRSEGITDRVPGSVNTVDVTWKQTDDRLPTVHTLPKHGSFFGGGFSEPRSVVQKQKLIRQRNQSQSVCLTTRLSVIFAYFFINLIFYNSLFIHFYSHLTASQVSWNITVYSITSSSASVRWLNFPLSANVTHYLVRYKEPSGVSVLFRASSYSNTHYTNRLKGYTSYDVQVFASTTGIDGNITYSSQTVSIETPEGGKLSGTYWVYMWSQLPRTI